MFRFPRLVKSPRLGLSSLWLALLASSAVPVVHAQGLPPSVVGALRVAHIPQQNTGVVVVDADNGKRMLAANNTGQPFNPASVMKLVTTDAALEILGPTYTWKTQAYIDGTLAGGVLNGDLILKGGGDPKLVLENFWLFLRQLRARGIKDIRGNLVLDRTYFAESSYDPSQFDGDPQKPYNAGPDALLMNYRTQAFRFEPDAASGVVSVSMDPPMAGITVTPPRLSQEPCGDWQGKLKMNNDPNAVSFTGSYSADCGPRVWYVHPYRMNNVQYVGASFVQMWADLGGSFAGRVVNGQVTPSARLMVEVQSPPLPEVIRDINKYSNNVMARQVLLTLGAEMTGQPGDTVNAARAVRGWLNDKGIDTNGLAIENGAGLSRVERVTPALLASVLVQAYRSPLMPEFVSSLPLVGYDGTMRRRLKTQSVAGQAHIKTGTLNDVRSIAGYVQAASGKTYVVVFLINHAAAPNGQQAQDALLQWVYENG
ncbi:MULTISPECIES: D-alanyl-D-alanine carboxypeptidase/D-alanyl-D-alanine-endopeptidase [unclassified Herbaspirillum]|uniref:D-alanyl-D-alanine carboxypeptidase/D-alanyl-D-alanine endopeptidase n=1 Tax=unclassified Herbaspirillum TaxID=2624150 RepID=UPI000C0A0C55|nr:MULTISPECIES: D-alanyl-D-alanine carboxypeptidase/D-alanyl-D-alanine-endopeptidase [unclassified Herbaspirillum]MAF04822.1 D-alanyl-D-alanine carboxypeptidase/D-alanyl-D-alanine-endopeptidase [Herbaspirillum sp.]|tara:strand:+ start:1669 stop:3117 length:1449 start_codon:yes stop_codon:yes gene_type:complete